MTEFTKWIEDPHKMVQDWKEKNKKDVWGYFCCVVPEEMIYAAGILPMRIMGSSERIEKVDEYVPPYGCQFVRSCLDLAGRGKYDYLDRVVIPNTCDLVARCEYFWRAISPKKTPTQAGLEIVPNVIYMRYPLKTDGKGVFKYILMELRQLKQYLERYIHEPLTDEKLTDAIKVYNEHYELMRRFHDLRKQDPLPVSGYEAWEAEITSLLMPKDQHNELMRDYLQKLNTDHNKPKQGVRLYLSASALDPQGAKLYKLIEECGGQVVSEDISVNTSYFWNKFDNSLPCLEAIADRILKIPCSRSTCRESNPFNRYNYLERTMEGHRIEGAIFYNLRYCECRSLEYPRIRDRLQRELNMPTLFLEGDYTEGGLEQLRGQIEAFVEMLGD